MEVGNFPKRWERVGMKLTAQARAVNRAESIHDARWSVNSKTRFSGLVASSFSCVLFAQNLYP